MHIHISPVSIYLCSYSSFDLSTICLCQSNDILCTYILNICLHSVLYCKKFETLFVYLQVFIYLFLDERIFHRIFTIFAKFVFIGFLNLMKCFPSFAWRISYRFTSYKGDYVVASYHVTTFQRIVIIMTIILQIKAQRRLILQFDALLHSAPWF